MSLRGEKYDTVRGDGDGDPGAASVNCDKPNAAVGV